MKNPIVLAILVVSGLILLAGCGGGMARFIVIPDSRKYSATQDFNVLEASALPDHFIKVAVLIDNQSGEQLPFTPAQAYLTTGDKKAVYSGLPLKQGYIQLVTLSQSGFPDGARGFETAVSGMVDSAKNQDWKAAAEDTIMPCCIPAHTALKGNLWFKWTKTQTLKLKGASEGTLLGQGANLLEAPLTLYVAAPDRELIFLLKLKDSKGVNY